MQRIRLDVTFAWRNANDRAAVTGCEYRALMILVVRHADGVDRTMPQGDRFEGRQFLFGPAEDVKPVIVRARDDPVGPGIERDRIHQAAAACRFGGGGETGLPIADIDEPDKSR